MSLKMSGLMSGLFLLKVSSNHTCAFPAHPGRIRIGSGTKAHNFHDSRNKGIDNDNHHTHRDDLYLRPSNHAHWSEQSRIAVCQFLCWAAK